MNAVTVKVRVAREAPNGISFKMSREGAGDDMVEGHASFVESVVKGGVSGLLELMGKPWNTGENES